MGRAVRLQWRRWIRLAAALCPIAVAGCGGDGAVGSAPVISLTAFPTQVMGGGDVTLTANVSAANGVASVAFFRQSPDAALLGRIDVPPFQWQAIAYGGNATVTTAFYARACDLAGLCTDSEIVQVISFWMPCKYPPCSDVLSTYTASQTASIFR